MVAITTLSGDVVELGDDMVEIVAGAYPGDVGPHTYVYGATRVALITAEAPQLLLGRLKKKEQFAVLTRPNGTPVWIRGPAVTALRAPLWTEIPYPGMVNAVVLVSQFHQPVREDIPTAGQILINHGAPETL
jgi:hypothetical protein